MLRKLSSIVAIAGLGALVVLGGVQAAPWRSGARAAARRHAPAPHRRVHGLLGPSLLTPGNVAHVEQIPTLTWNAAGGAVEYEYQVSADPRFHSIVLGSGRGRGTAVTHNLAASLSESVTDGTYYWRVRGINAAKQPGPWSATRSLVKSWSAAPRPLGPAPGTAITWPSAPLVLRWTPVPFATEYIVTIATDPGLSNIVLGSTTAPQKTEATVFALPGTLATGQYYWAITPIDNRGHRGSRSAVSSFGWLWPSETATSFADLNPSPQAFEPQFNWAPMPGAAHYEVEVNSAFGFPLGSKWCCEEKTIGTSLTPTKVLKNNEYFWRVRAIDASGNAGEWNEGPGFEKLFDTVTPTIPDLTMRDAHGNPLPAGVSTATPIVTWSPVPGASSYEVQVTIYTGAGCDWSAFRGEEKQTVETSSLAWTPIGPDSNRIGPSGWPNPRNRTTLLPNRAYCVRVFARSDLDAMRNRVESASTQLGGPGQPAFTFAAQPIPSGKMATTSASDYISPTSGSISPRTPLFTWERVPGASLYYVVIARDPTFTTVVDLASTVVPAYAPPLGEEEPLDDETTAYYWAVIPVNAEGRTPSEPSEDAPQSFNKSSVPPTPLGPVNGVTVSTQPTFSWTPAEGALNYTLQVSEDPTFGKPIDNVRTDSTAYTSSSTYPPDVTLYWRVRANDTNERREREGLNWSAIQTFRRTLPTPSPLPGNPTSSEAIPALSFTPVTGATGYDVHVEEPNGVTKDFNLDSTSFAPTSWAGPGIWRWQVRAEFPTAGSSTVPGGYSATQSLVHLFAAPSGAVGTKSGARIVISWNPDPYAREYEVQVSTSESFSSNIDSQKVDGTSWAPSIDLSQAGNRGTLYWRVAALNSRRDPGPYAMGSFVRPRPKPRCIVKKVKRGKRTVKKCVVRKKKHR